MSDFVSTNLDVRAVEFHLEVPSRHKVGEAIEMPDKNTMVWGHDYDSGETDYTPICLGLADDFSGAADKVQKHIRSWTE